MFRFSVVAEQYIREHGDNCSHIARNIEKQRVFCAFRGTAKCCRIRRCSHSNCIIPARPVQTHIII